jgi:aarF domain-containing kinase
VGQVFATKADVLPPQYPRVLRNAFDACPPAAFSTVKRTLERELGAPVETLFAHIDPQPLATATIAQVHAAQLHDGTRVAVKVQHDGMERVMRSDLLNMLRVSEFLQWAQFDLNFDQVSIIREYQVQVPLEFDFCRERRLLTAIGTEIEANTQGRVTSPRPVERLCSRRVLTMQFMDGVSFSALQRSMDATHEQLKPAAGTSPGEMTAMVTDLLRSFGHQIFTLGVFHSDPHPGNIIRRPDGSVGLLDFGECKELGDRERLLFARLTIALAQRHPAAALPLLSECGLVIDGATPEFAMVVAYIVFDTRMDMKEAHMSPLDADADDMRAVKLKTLPPELFMIVRVATLIRGMLAIFKCDVSASQVWEPYARAALQRAGIPPPPPPPPKLQLAAGKAAAGSSVGRAQASATDEGQEVGGIYERMYRLAEWMQKHELPHDRKALTPFAMAGVTTVAEIAAADPTRLAAACKKLTAQQRDTCVALAKAETAAAAAAAAASAIAAASKLDGPRAANGAARFAGVVKAAQAQKGKSSGGGFKGLVARLRA